jgi:DMSO/TMAO reductase YedYZ molybdopterin-dependent catalytic subunit
MSPLDRRTFLKIGSGALFGIAFTPLLGGCDGGTVEPPFTLEGFAPFITPTDRFYVQFGGRDTIDNWSMPSVERATWSMQIRGEVATPMTLTWTDIQTAIEQGHERTLLKTMRCVLDGHLRPGQTGWTGNAYWKGVPLRHFLDPAGIDRSRARRILFRGYDGFLNNITLERFGTGDLGEMEPLLVYAMNGEDLRPEHGAPVRLLLLETYGYKSIKWLQDVNVIAQNTPSGQYQREGFVDDGVIRVASRSENVAENISIAPGLVEITGHALSGAGKVSAVEISIDDAAFVPIEIEPYERVFGGLALPSDIYQLADRRAYPYRGVWTKWRYRWNAAAGAHTIAIRASDSSGAVQQEDDFDLKDGQSGVVRYNVTVS